MENFISIITPSYNRAYILPQLYASLCSQNCKEFEWIVVDDGSKDNTFELVNKWLLEQRGFHISVFHQENGGKHRAVNFGVSVAKGSHILIADSDDMLTKDAIFSIYKWLEESKNVDNLAAVAGLRGKKQDNSVLGDYPADYKYSHYVDAKNTERRKKHLLGDKAEVYRSDLLKKNPFHTFEGENFLTESTVWDELAYQGYKVRWYNKVIYLCEYLEDGLTNSGFVKELNSFKGFTYSIRQRIKCNGRINGLVARGYYYNLAKKKSYSLRKAANMLDTSCLLMIIGIVVWNLKKVIGK